MGLLERHNCYIRVQSLQGLRLARDNMGYFTAFQIEDREQWTEWKGVPKLGVDDLVLQWDSPEKDLIFHYQVCLLFVFQSPWLTALDEAQHILRS